MSFLALRTHLLQTSPPTPLCIWVTQAGQKQTSWVSPPPPQRQPGSRPGPKLHQMPSPGTTTLDQVSQGQWGQQEGSVHLPEALALGWPWRHPDKASRHLLGFLPLRLTSGSPRPGPPASFGLREAPTAAQEVPFPCVSLRTLLTHSQTRVPARLLQTWPKGRLPPTLLGREFHRPLAWPLAFISQPDPVGWPSWPRSSLPRPPAPPFWNFLAVLISHVSKKLVPGSVVASSWMNELTHVEVSISAFGSHSPTSAGTEFLLLALRVSFLSQPPQPSMSHGCGVWSQTSRLRRLRSYRPSRRGRYP